MKRLMVVLALLVLVFASGCLSQEIKDKILLNFVRSKRYVELMDAGKTTSDQDKRYLKNMTMIAAALDFKINESKDAKEWYDAEKAKKASKPDDGGGGGNGG